MQPMAPALPSVFYLVPVHIPTPVPVEVAPPASTRKAWSKEEDNRILELIMELNLNKSSKIPYKQLAKYFPQRTSKQIRERYLNNLDSSINKAAFSPEEDDAVLEFYRSNGPKWRRLSTLLSGRTPSALKNRFNTKIKMRLLEGKETKDSSRASQSASIGTSLVGEDDEAVQEKLEG